TTLPDVSERAPQELGLQTALGQALMVTCGYAAPEVEQVNARALELCRRIGETPQLFPVLEQLQAFYLISGKLQKSRHVGEQRLSLAQASQDPALLASAYYLHGEVLYWLGEVVPARKHLEQAHALHNPQRSYLMGVGHDSGVACLSILG